MTDEEIGALAIEIADEDTYCEIESMCTWTEEAGHRWYDVGDRVDGSVKPFVDRAVRYRSLRNLIARHPTNGNLIRLEKGDDDEGRARQGAG